MALASLWPLRLSARRVETAAPRHPLVADKPRPLLALVGQGNYELLALLAAGPDKGWVGRRRPWPTHFPDYHRLLTAAARLPLTAARVTRMVNGVIRDQPTALAAGFGDLG